MASYMDMVTVLMCLFIVLYAMSTIDSSKFKTLANSLATGFGENNSKIVDVTKGVVVPKDQIVKNGVGFTAQTSLAAELKAKIQTALKAAGSKSVPNVTIVNHTVVIGLVGSSAYFAPNDAAMAPDAVTVLHAIAPRVSQGDYPVTIEGHADPHGSPGAYESDWDLAAARATTVLKYLVDNGDVSGSRISAVSYGSSRTTAKDTTLTEQEHNRRVDIVLHTLG